jgi:hypothetical protein
MHNVNKMEAYCGDLSECFTFITSPEISIKSGIEGTP